MGFNKSKVKSSAERYMTQGRISEAIKEYRLIIENDPKDINTQNILGDLYSKSDDTQAAVNCYKYVAEHYNSQGFAKKAIAIYNKIHRLKPDSISVSEKLAELYHVRGSLAEARKYYEQVAAHHEEKGNKAEALEIWEKVAELAPNNTEIYLKIADAHWRNKDQEAAAEAFIEGGKRLVANGQYEEGVAALSRALDVVPDDIGAIKAYVECQLSLGYPEEAVKILEDTLEESSNKKEIIFLLADCHLELDDPEKAEEVIVDLVVREPINYPKLFDLIEYYLKKDDVDSAVRILSMVSEQVLVSAKSERLLDFLNEILARNPEQTQALRLLARYYEWNKEKAGRQKTLEQLLEVSRLNEVIEDERFALKQLVQLDPNDDYSERLKEIHNNHGSEEDSARQKSQDENSNEVLVVEALSVLAPEEGAHSNNGFGLDSDEAGEELEGINPVIIEESDIPERVESIKFYVEQGYNELAESSLKELIGAFGNREEFAEACELLNISPEDHYTEDSIRENQDAVSGDDSVEEVVLEASETEEESPENIAENEELVEEVESEDISEEEKQEEDDEVAIAEEEATESIDESEEVQSVGFEITSSENVAEPSELAEREEVEDAEETLEETAETSDEVEEIDEESQLELDEVEEEAEGDETEVLEQESEEAVQQEDIEEGQEAPVYGVIEGSIEEEALGEAESEDEIVSDEIDDEEEVSAEDEEEVEASEDDEEVIESVDDEDSDEAEEVEGSVKEQDVEIEEPDEEVELVADNEKELEASEDLENSVEENLEDDETEETDAVVEQVDEGSAGLEDIRTVLNADADEEDADDVYETHYHHAVAYKEMGLMEDAIREFQNAIKCIAPTDEDGKYLQCSTLLGHCFMEKDMPKLAVMWFTRAYEVEGLNSDERQALQYELANAHEANGDIDKAREQFEEIYAFDVDYRDVSERLEKVAQPVA